MVTGNAAKCQALDSMNTTVGAVNIRAENTSEKWGHVVLYLGTIVEAIPANVFTLSSMMIGTTNALEAPRLVFEGQHNLTAPTKKTAISA